jgi:hypothetical protein
LLYHTSEYRADGTPPAFLRGHELHWSGGSHLRDRPQPLCPKTHRPRRRPLLEDELRLHPDLRNSAKFLSCHPDLARFLANTPDLPPALRTYPRYFLYRALLREVRVPVKHSELAQLNAFFEHDADVEHALVIDPGEIRRAEFLSAHSKLTDFLKTHPPLDRAFLP